MSLSGQLKHGDVSKDIWQDSERAGKEENTSDLLPPFHKVMSDSLECHLANDRVAVLEMELAERDRMLRLAAEDAWHDSFSGDQESDYSELWVACLRVRANKEQQK